MKPEEEATEEGEGMKPEEDGFYWYWEMRPKGPGHILLIEHSRAEPPKEMDE